MHELLIEHGLLGQWACTVDGQEHRHSGTRADVAVDLNTAAMLTRNLVDEAQTDASSRDGPDIAAAKETFANPTDLVRRYADSMIFNHYFDEVVLRLGRERRD